MPLDDSTLATFARVSKTILEAPLPPGYIRAEGPVPLDAEWIRGIPSRHTRSLLMLLDAAWKSDPQGSLPASDLELARIAGVRVRWWPRFAASVLRDFALCADGRIYHLPLCDLTTRNFCDTRTRTQKDSLREEIPERSIRNHRSLRSREDSESLNLRDSPTTARDTKTVSASEDLYSAKGDVFRKGVPFLRRHVTTDGQARGILGRLARDVGCFEDLLLIVENAIVAEPRNPVAYLCGCVRREKEPREGLRDRSSDPVWIPNRV